MIDLFPDLNNPRIFIEVTAGERPPEEIEQQFVESIESLAIRQKKVIQVSSITRVGSAQITVEYSWDADMDEAFLNIQKSLTTFNQNSDIDELTITQHDPNAVPVMLLGLSHSQITDMDELRRTAENYLRNDIKMGYRAPYLLEFAQKVANNQLNLIDFENTQIPTADLYKQLRNIKGFGDYAVSNLLKLLGRYDYLGADSWSRQKFAEKHNNGKKCDDKKIEHFYRKFDKWAGLFFWMDVSEDWYKRDKPW